MFRFTISDDRKDEEDLTVDEAGSFRMRDSLAEREMPIIFVNHAKS